MNEESMIVACKLIADAGDGAAKFLSAIKEAEKNMFKDAKEYFDEGSESLLKAHRKQTALLHAEAQGNVAEYSLLMVHAQDHLMNANLLKDLTEVIISLNKRVHNLEVKYNEK